MKKDIFHGKIKQEYFSYILGYMIFFVLLFVGIGVLCICAAIWGMTPNPMGERILVGGIGVIFFMLAFGFFILELLVIRGYPKYEKLRRSLFNSDIYFTDSSSSEYFGGSRTIRGRMNKLAFEVVTAFAREEKRLGNKMPSQYKKYLALVVLLSVLGLASLIIMPFLFENGAILPKISQDTFLFCYIFVAVVCIAFAIFFLARAYKVAITAPLENNRWKSALYTSLVDIAVRRNNKKHKFWYESTQLNEIEELVRAASEHAEFRPVRKNDTLVSFTVVDTLNDHITFTGFFI